MLNRYWWRLFTKPQRDYFLDRLPVIDRETMKKTLSRRCKVSEPLIERNCIFVHVPKCAGKSLCASLLGGWGPGHLPLYWYEQMFPEFYSGAFKFGFVRDPLDRAYSAYCYLLGNRHIKQDQSARRMVEHFGSFDAFVAGWLCPENIQRQIHFVPQWQFLSNSLGQVAVDYLGRFESLDKDFSEICRRLGMQESLVHTNRSKLRDTQVLCSDLTRQRVLEVYRRDYELFGYLPQ